MGYGAEGMKYRFQWNFPIIFSKHNPKKLYTFSNQVHVSENEGQSWEIISPDLTRNDPERLKSSGGPITQDNTGVEYYCTLFAANESPLEEGLLWVGSDDGLLHLTRDGGKNWTNVTPAQMPKWLMINSIDPSPFDPAVCYVAGTLYKTGDFTPYLYKTSDYGQSWVKITKGINKEHFTRVLRADPSRKGLLYAGTETGMYISFDDGASWNPFQLNLPIVPITDLTLKDNSLIVATQGRSLWMIDDLTVLHQLNRQAVGQEMTLFKPKDSYRTQGRTRSSLTQGTNLPNGVIVHFNVKDFNAAKDTIQLHVKEKNGELIKTFSTATEKDKLDLKVGGNQFVWNTRYKGAERLDGMILWGASLSGAKAVPGNYLVSLQKNELVIEQSFTILPDPRAEVTVADMQRQFDFVNSINQTLDEAHQAIKNIRIINEKLDAFETNYGSLNEAKEILKIAADLKKEFSEIEKALYQTQNKSNQDPLNFPIRLTNKLGHINNLVMSNDFPPTDQDIVVSELLSSQINLEMEHYNKLVNEDLEFFNKTFAALKLDYLTLK